MAKRSLGYVELNWECPNCQAKNQGMQKTCKQCGAPQPAEVAFQLDKDASKIEDDAKLAQAAAGADFHCPFCGTRNTASSKVCSQCGGDIAEGKRRSSGAKVAESQYTHCPKCGNKNPTTAPQCAACGTSLTANNNMAAPPPPTSNPIPTSGFRPWMALPVVAFLLLACSLIWFLFFRSTSMPATVSQTHWSRSIAVEALVDVQKEAWRDEVPAGGQIQSCQTKYRTTSDTPGQNSKEVCTTEIVDQGNGTGEVVETCQYEIYDDRCTYTIQDWAEVDVFRASGEGNNAVWPMVSIGANQREGNARENYEVVFSTQDGEKTYTTQDFSYFQNFSPGSQWMISVNTFGGIVDITQ